jgi:hypothetical protein
MAYCTYSDVNLYSNITSNDVSDSDITSIIAGATKELNGLINVRVTREPVVHIDSTRENTIDGSNTTFYVQNWKGKYLADMDNDGDVDTDDIIVYQVDSDGTETQLTVSSIDHDDGKFVLSSAPTAGKRLYATYEWCYRDVATPDEKVKMACIFLTTAYCYAKLNIGRAPIFAVGNKRIYRDMDSFDKYYQRAMKLVNEINAEMPKV